MPIVHIELLEGRTNEQKQAMVKEVTEAISRTSGAPKENIHVVIQEMKKEHYAIAGKLKSEV
ncbi:2-hydroxymuconate tautomerase [Vagococcus xieshaowenii]|uniref:Tautomerase n=1 Tax=Vagococcus xieshaowenii TaxID=2562451 RepID=A0AAJ5EFR7_9ENTE|nr:2-hydroxymuconate tautomerase [Vagococcus xieshaowenii]QCA28602.1 4-oxalocrotonate tautomerase [Vagococcus xieshaowenii]TFZ40590.1 4-oxalocrotonate tautomerase [Vagococcus xieshaowenii]